MIHIHQFVTESDVNYYKSMTNDAIKKKLKINEVLDSVNAGNDPDEELEQIDLRKLYGLPDGDIDVLLQQFREDNFTQYCRRKDWELSYIKVLNNDGTINDYHTWTASFRYANKWNQESDSQKYRIIVDDNNKILWIGVYNKDDYFISVGKNIYSFSYEHKDISMFPNISDKDEYFSDEAMELNDGLIIKYRENLGTLRFSGSFDDVKAIFSEERIGARISIDEYFEKGFFYKGLKWNKSYDFLYPRNITILLSIQARNNLFCIELENITYPFHGYILLDLNELRIIEAKKMKID